MDALETCISLRADDSTAIYMQDNSHCGGTAGVLPKRLLEYLPLADFIMLTAPPTRASMAATQLSETGPWLLRVSGVTAFSRISLLKLP